MRHAPILLALLLAPPLGGCGASTLRLELSPSIGTGGRPGFDALVSAGFGLPLDLRGRSHHFVQARYGIGGGYDGHTRGRMLAMGWDLDYIYWAEPRFDVRAGGRFVIRDPQKSDRDPTLYGAALRFGVLPVVAGNAGGVIGTQLCVGPELRVEHLWSAPPGQNRGVFALPLVIEGNVFTSGD